MDHSTMEHIRLPDGGMVMVMQGMPGWLFGLAIGAVILLSFVVVEWRGLADGPGWTWNLTRSPRVHRLVRQRWFQPAFQLPVLALFGFVIYAGLFGSFAKNLAPVMVWTLWWAALIFVVALAGNVWCFVCPWDAAANVMTRLTLWKKRASLSLGLALPASLQNVYPAIALFVVLTWLELGFGITNNPRQTAVLGLAMVAAAVGMALVFEKKAFCRSFCFVGRISGMYSMFSPVEIRPRDRRVCGVCTTRDCLTGNDRGYACPTGLDLGELDVSTHCISCTECFKTCPSLAPAVRLRPLNRDISRVRTPRGDEAWLALVLLALTGFHGLSMTPVWQDYSPGSTDIVTSLSQWTGLAELGAFTVGMVGVMAAPLLAYALVNELAWRWSGRTVGRKDLFVAYAYAVLPVALFYHLAHNAMHLFMEGQDVVPLLSDPLGRGADWFGTASWHMDPLLGQNATWAVQVSLILVGHVAGIVASHRISRRLFADPVQARRSLLPMLVMMIVLSVLGLWLMHLDMNMRMGRM